MHLIWDAGSKYMLDWHKLSNNIIICIALTIPLNFLVLQREVPSIAAYGTLD